MYSSKHAFLGLRRAKSDRDRRRRPKDVDAAITEALARLLKSIQDLDRKQPE